MKRRGFEVLNSRIRECKSVRPAAARPSHDARQMGETPVPFLKSVQELHGFDLLRRSRLHRELPRRPPGDIAESPKLT
jgi:hypothetical protein